MFFAKKEAGEGDQIMQELEYDIVIIGGGPAGIYQSSVQRL